MELGPAVKHERSGQTGVPTFQLTKHPRRPRPDIMPVPNTTVNPAPENRTTSAGRRRPQLNCRKNYFLLGIDAALLDRVGNPVNRQHVGRDPVIYVMGLGIPNNVLERRHHDFL